MTLGFVIGESKPTLVTAQTSRSLPIGEYVIIDSQDGKIVGLAEKSVVSSAALGDIKNYDEALESFVADRCDVYSNYVTELIKVRINLPNSSNYKILPEIISKEPLAIVVRHADDNWRDVVSWSFKVMLNAEELNINSTNVDMYKETTNGEIMRLLGLVGAYGDMIELDEKWAYNIIKYVGNYKEIYERNLGPETIVNLEIGLNNLYNNGGLLYAPPFR